MSNISVQEKEIIFRGRLETLRSRWVLPLLASIKALPNWSDSTIFRHWFSLDEAISQLMECSLSIQSAVGLSFTPSQLAQALTVVPSFVNSFAVYLWTRRIVVSSLEHSEASEALRKAVSSVSAPLPMPLHVLLILTLSTAPW